MEKRAKNYSEREKLMVVHLVEKYAHIIENKATDSATIHNKGKTWDKICLEYNAVSETGPRDCNQLKNLYKNLKRSTKKEVATQNKRKFLDAFHEEVEEVETDIIVLKKMKTHDKNETYKTGGGSYTPQLKEPEAQLLALVEEQVQPLENPYDDGAVYHGDSSENLILPLPDTPKSNAPNNPPSKRRKVARRVQLQQKSEHFKKLYYKQKFLNAKFQLKSMQQQHALDMQIKRKQLRNIVE